MHAVTLAVLAALTLAAPVRAQTVAAPGAPGHGTHADGETGEVTVSDGVEIHHPWAAATDGRTARVFLRVHNTRATPVLLTGATTAAAASVGVRGVGFGEEAGAGVPLGEIEIAAGSTFHLDEDGVFLHLDDLTGPLVPGAAFELAITFEGLAPIAVKVGVEADDGTGQGHAGHSH